MLSIIIIFGTLSNCKTNFMFEFYPKQCYSFSIRKNNYFVASFTIFGNSKRLIKWRYMNGNLLKTGDFL